MVLIAENYTNAYNPGGAPQVYIGKSDFSGIGAEPAYEGRMRVVVPHDGRGRRLLHNPLSGHYWDERPDHHGRFIVEAQNDRDAVRIFRERRW